MTVYPQANYTVVSSTFLLEAGGKNVDVVSFMDYHYAHFSFNGEIAVTVTASEKVNTFNISPHSLKISGQQSGNKLSFTIRQGSLTPNYLIIQVNSLEKLVILADPHETDIPPMAGEGIYNIKMAPYNADPTGSENATDILQRALDEAAAAGGGVVYIPAGVYKVTKTIMITGNNVELYLEGGAVIKASENRSDYEGTGYSDTFMVADNAVNIRIRGRGVLDASGYYLFNKVFNDETKKYEDRRGVLRGRDCTNFLVEGVTVKDGTTWTVTVYTSEDILLRNVKVLNYKDVNEYKIENDGINICSSRYAQVDRCFVMTIDDSLCSKAANKGVPTHSIIFSNNVLFNSCAGHKSGMQVQGPMYNIWFINNDIVQCRRGIVAESTSGEETMNAIHYIDIRVEKQISTFEGPRNIDFIALTGSISDIRVENVVFEEQHESRLNVAVSKFISNVSVDEVYANNVKYTDLSQFIVIGSARVSNVIFNDKIKGNLLHKINVANDTNWPAESVNTDSLPAFSVYPYHTGFNDEALKRLIDGDTAPNAPAMRFKAGSQAAYIRIDFGAPKTVSRLVITSGKSNGDEIIKSYRLRYYDGDTPVTIKTVSDNTKRRSTVTFPPVTAQRFDIVDIPRADGVNTTLLELEMSEQSYNTLPMAGVTGISDKSVVLHSGEMVLTVWAADMDGEVIDLNFFVDDRPVNGTAIRNGNRYVCTVKGMFPGELHNIAVKATDNLSGETMSEGTLIYAAHRNVALGKTVIGSRNGDDTDSNFTCLTDGDIGSHTGVNKWYLRKSPYSAWVEIDLGDEHNITGSMVVSGRVNGEPAETARNYKVQYQSDSQWLDIPGASVVDNELKVHAYNYSRTIKTRRIRFIFDGFSPDYACPYRIREIAVFADEPLEVVYDAVEGSFTPEQPFAKRIRAKNGAGDDREVILIMALYDGDGRIRMIDIDEKKTIIPKGTANFRAGFDMLPNNLDDSYIKVFLWDGDFCPYFPAEFISGI
ncbi:MAG: discoidin domain-containing protein [Firmicutes bacterium]|nr:discoidin domain-containing protein [Bacillota bacterium]